MKPKVAFYWCASCGGCEEAILDLGPALLDVLDAVDIVFWPVALDFKEHDVAAMHDDAIDISFVNGAVRTSEQERMARLMRTKSKTVVAFGACAQLGGVPGLANLFRAADLVREAYGAAAPREDCAQNGHDLSLPKLYDRVLPLDRVIKVDYYIPGCAPSAKIISAALAALLAPARPARGAVLAPDHALCDECPRNDTRPEPMVIHDLRRVPDAPIDPSTCILAQGLPCLGPATRAGCEARCVRGNMPCTGCFGPNRHVRDFGGKALSAIASVIATEDPNEARRVFDHLPDAVGTFYRYSLPNSFLDHKYAERNS